MATPAAIKKVVISSTYESLKDCRREAERAVIASKMYPISMERDDFAGNYSLLQTSLDKVREADIYIGIFSQHYSDLTEEELREAQRRGIPVLIFLATGKLNELDDELDPANREKLNLLKDELAKTYLVATFSTPVELREKVYRSLEPYRTPAPAPPPVDPPPPPVPTHWPQPQTVVVPMPTRQTTPVGVWFVLAALVVLITVVSVALVPRLVRGNPSQTSTTSPSGTTVPAFGGPAHALAHVLQVRHSTTLVDSNHQAINDCGASMLDNPVNVVALDDQAAFALNGQPYIRVAYPERCPSTNQYDFGGNTIAYINWNDVAETTFATPDPYPATHGAIWKRCWDPNQCTREEYPNANDALHSGDGPYLLAWIVNGAIDPHWWHGRSASGADCSLYGRDWNAKP